MLRVGGYREIIGRRDYFPVSSLVLDRLNKRSREKSAQQTTFLTEQYCHGPFVFPLEQVVLAYYQTPCRHGFNVMKS